MLSIGSDVCSEVDWQMASQQGSFLAKDQRAYISGEELHHKPPFCFVLKGVMLDARSYKIDLFTKGHQELSGPLFCAGRVTLDAFKKESAGPSHHVLGNGSVYVALVIQRDEKTLSIASISSSPISRRG
jgi:hypothetical protein